MMAAAIRVLYVDDEPALLDAGKLILEQSGDFTVTTALGAPDAVRLLEQRKFDAIVSDYQMPKVDGIQFLVLVRSRFGSIPFILFTGRGREEVVIQAINSGADFYLQKGGESEAQFAELSHKIKSAAARKMADDALRESEERYRSLFENMLEGFAYCRMLYENGRPTDFIYLNVNPAFNRVIGTSVVVGKPVTEVFPGIKEAFPELFEIYGRVASTGEPESFDIDFKPSKKWLHISVYSPAKEYFVAIFEDITGRKRAEEVLTENEARLRTTLGILPVGVFIFSRNGQILTANAMVNQIWGVTNGVVPHSHDMQEFVEYKGWWPDTGIALRPEDWAASRVLLKGETAPVDIVNIQRFDGSNGTIIVSAVPFHDAGGDVTGAVAVIQDITGRKRAEEELKGISRSLADAMNLAKMAAWEYDVAKETFTFNDALYAMHGMTAEDAGGYRMSARTFAEKYTVPAYARQVFDTVRQALESPDSHFELTVEGELKRQDGTTFWVVTWFRAERDASGSVVRLHGVNQDITERKRAEDALQLKDFAIASSINAIAIADLSGNLTYVNPAFLSIWGYEDLSLIHI